MSQLIGHADVDGAEGVLVFTKNGTDCEHACGRALAKWDQSHRDPQQQVAERSATGVGIIQTKTVAGAGRQMSLRVMDRDTGRSRYFGFVELHDRQATRKRSKA